MHLLQAELNTSNSFVSDTAINPSSVPVSIVFQPSVFNVTSKQNGIGQVTFTNLSGSQTSISQVSISQISTPERSHSKDSSGEINSTEIGSIQTSLIHNSSTQIGSTQIEPFQKGFRQILPAEIDSTQISGSYVTNPNFVASKIPDPTSVQSQDLFILNPWFSTHGLSTNFCSFFTIALAKPLSKTCV